MRENCTYGSMSGRAYPITRGVPLYSTSRVFGMIPHKNRVVEQNRCYHLVSRLAHRAYFLDDEEKDRAVALMRRVEAGVNASMSYGINRAVSISSDPFDPTAD